ncbi:MAG: peptidoglycan-associated lipoprotein Pal [Rubrivivax sp.]|nr:peptidoglycan-associated lipoprotein Pal [Pseudomonadota bacterium]MCW5638088.1 peptidoglycan-associated lipoprotein Pal [Rubrivivax sp.]
MRTMHRTWKLAGSLLAAALIAAGCSSTKLDEAPVETRTPVPADGQAGGGAGSKGAPQSGVATVDLTKGGASADAAALAQRVVYFDFDSFVVKDEFRPMLEAHAKALAANRGSRMMVEGHTDERGGREYNLALGQKRADAVVKTLVLLGASDNQLEAVSFGKERPADPGHDEAAWAQNRRVELKSR